MERKTHILFSIVWIYWSAFIIDNSFNHIHYLENFSNMILSMPLVTIPYLIIATTLPDTDLKNNRLNKTILFPAFFLLRLFVKHRWFTHRIEGILFFWFILYFLSLFEPNFLTLLIISFLAISMVFIIIDDLSIKILWQKRNKFNLLLINIEIPKKFIDIFLSLLILLLFPTLLDENNFKLFLFWIFVWYVFHMFWDALSKEWWTIIKIPYFKKKINFSLPSYLAFRVWGFFETKILRNVLWISLICMIYFNFDYFSDKFFDELFYSMKLLSDIM